jgi:hypothetical protein
MCGRKELVTPRCADSCLLHKNADVPACLFECVESSLIRFASCHDSSHLVSFRLVSHVSPRPALPPPNSPPNALSSVAYGNTFLHINHHILIGIFDCKLPHFHSLHPRLLPLLQPFEHIDVLLADLKTVVVITDCTEEVLKLCSLVGQ